jgi:hypothetical protein
MYSVIRKRLIRWGRRLSFSKRQQFVIIVATLTAGLILTQLVSQEYRYSMVGLLSVLTYVGFAVGLREDLRGAEWFTLLTLPTLFTAAVALFYFLLPVRWLTRIPIAILYAVGMYALILTENIYNIAAIRTIALLRAAHSVGFLLTLVTYFLLVQTTLSFRLPPFIQAPILGALSFPLIAQSLWSMELEQTVSGRVWQLSVALAFVQMQLSWFFSFWPVKMTLQALFFTTGLYGSMGMAQQYLVERLYKKTVIEFFSVTTIVLFVILIATRWRGAP